MFFVSMKSSGPAQIARLCGTCAYFSVILIAALCPSDGCAATFKLESTETRTSLLELFTSEGCSSCPPAEAWLTGLKQSVGLWKDFVPVAFHVDYWDHLGWTDRWSSKRFTERQQHYASAWRNNSIYTPGLVWDGKEWRGWFDRKELPRSFRIQAGTLTATSEDGRQWTFQFKPSAHRQASFEIHAALLGFDIVTKVQAGENQGRSLTHDFTALAFAERRMIERDGGHRAELALEAARGIAFKRSGIAVWVTVAGEVEPVQALGGWLTEQK